MSVRAKDIQAAEVKSALLEIAELHDGVLNPHLVVEAASEPDHPLHDRFEWDDSAAAEKYRLAQAEALIRRVKLHILRPNKESKQVQVSVTRAFQSLPSNRGSEGGYESITTIMADAGKRDELVRTVARELLAVRRKYAQLTELAEVWYAVDTTLAKYEPRTSAADELRPNA